MLPLTRDARIALRRWVRVRADVPALALFIRLPFQQGRLAPLHYGTLGRLVAAYAHRAGLTLPPRKQFHHPRHTAGQRMSELGMNIEVAQTFLGHENPTNTQNYYAVSDARLRRCVQRFRY